MKIKSVCWIPLTKGYWAQVDLFNSAAVLAYQWHADEKKRNVYAVRVIVRPNGVCVKQYLHEFLMPGIKGIDHKNGDGLDDCMSNLRAATRQQNSRGYCRKPVGATSKYRGVSWCTKEGVWRAQICTDYKSVILGRFLKEEDAARAYDAAARKRDPEFCHLNFP